MSKKRYKGNNSHNKLFSNPLKFYSETIYGGVYMKNKIIEKNKITYTKENLIKNIAEASGKNMGTVRAVYNELENIIAECLSSASIDTDISIRLFEGITIDSTFIPEKTKVNNLTGQIITTTKKIKPKANITRNYCEKLSACIE